MEDVTYCIDASCMGRFPFFSKLMHQTRIFAIIYDNLKYDNIVYMSQFFLFMTECKVDWLCYRLEYSSLFLKMDTPGKTRQFVYYPVKLAPSIQHGKPFWNFPLYHTDAPPPQKKNYVTS